VGAMDKTIHKLDCMICDITEEQSILEKGSGWRSFWNEGPVFSNFVVSWSKGGATEPILLSAKCRACDKDALHQQRYGA